MQIRIITELAEFQKLADIWDGLLDKCRGNNSIYLTHEWISTWWKHLGEKKKIFILLFEKERQITGVMPLIRNEYGLAFLRIGVIESLGAPGCNYMGLILPENREEAAAAFLTFLKENSLTKRAVLRLSLIPEDSRFLGLLRQNIADRSSNFFLQERVNALAPYVKLPEKWEEYYRQIGSNRRSALSRASRALTVEKGTAELYKYGSGSMEEGLNSLFSFHQERWKSAGVKSKFADSRTREFYIDVAGKLLKRNWLDLSVLRVNQEAVSVSFGCLFMQKYYGMIYARNLQYAKYAVGHLHDQFILKDVIEKKFEEFDFMQGDEPYKFYWCKSIRRLMQITVIKKGFMPGLRIKIIYFFIRLCEISRHSIKEMYAYHLIHKKEKQEHRRMGISAKLERLKRKNNGCLISGDTF
jgi:CelD/BcsL family acetyltransferase involved in cellulose biosynthesis